MEGVIVADDVDDLVVPDVPPQAVEVGQEQRSVASVPTRYDQLPPPVHAPASVLSTTAEKLALVERHPRIEG